MDRDLVSCKLAESISKRSKSDGRYPRSGASSAARGTVGEMRKGKWAKSASSAQNYR